LDLAQRVLEELLVKCCKPIRLSGEKSPSVDSSSPEKEISLPMLKMAQEKAVCEVFRDLIKQFTSSISIVRKTVKLVTFFSRLE
jgi:hypothetical protein